MTPTRPQGILFVGEKRSKMAIRMGVTWQDGRLSAKTLDEAVRPLGLARLGIPSTMPYDVLNAYRDYGDYDMQALETIAMRHRQGWLVIGMGRAAQHALDWANIPYTSMIHPAARGHIRLRARYQAHVSTVLQPWLTMGSM